jgi:hypothetical protein
MKELIEIQSKLKVPKGQRNTFGNYNYRSCEDILKAAKPLLAEQDCYLVMSDEMVEVGSRVYVKATVTITNGPVGNSESISVTAYARESESRKGMKDDQITGSASSYARKYALNGLFCIDDTKDSDATNKHEKEKTESLPPANMEYLSSDEGIAFLKTKGKNPLEAIEWLAKSRTVTLANEALIQELWSR